ncbi:MAG: EAL domain-containing protein [Fibromonadaceae bacterium]|jgi:EAL domain-containing protein (putative c-di-GMP-specific phosphodiesterase class I)|nr:EAL domain-containing protein [Fibromonadaceae bacterium]
MKSDIQTEIEFQKLIKVLEGKYIKPVYQPIASLIDGQIFGFEALSRITDGTIDINIEQLFKIADKAKKAWELETLCREKSLCNAANMGEKKLFLNVEPNIIHDEKFRGGFTIERLKEYGLNSDNIIFEISERVAVSDSDVFLGSIKHYKQQNFKIAIDDVGAGFSGLNTIASIKPDIIKIDMNLVRNIDKDETKMLLCKSLVDFGKNAGMKLIAEGIETEDELKILVKLKVDFGQGYFLGIPQEKFEEITEDKIDLIKKLNSKHCNENIKNSIYPIVGNLSKLGYTFTSDKKIGEIYEALKRNPTITEFTVVDSGKALGFMTKTALNELMNGKNGFWLHSKETIKEAMDINFLKVDYNMPIDQASRFAMQRPQAQLYNPIVVQKDNEYWGIVTIKDLLDTYTKIEVEATTHINPLTSYRFFSHSFRSRSKSVGESFPLASTAYGALTRNAPTAFSATPSCPFYAFFKKLTAAFSGCFSQAFLISGT